MLKTYSWVPRPMGWFLKIERFNEPMASLAAAILSSLCVLRVYERIFWVTVRDFLLALHSGAVTVVMSVMIACLIC